MKVTVCQIHPHADAITKQVQALKDHIHEQGTDFVLLPEMCFSPWLAADKETDEGRWHEACKNHLAFIEGMSDWGISAILGTRPIVLDSGERRNQAYLWTAEMQCPEKVHDKYYLPNEEGYWEATWYDRGEKVFESAQWGETRIGTQICTEMWYYEWARHFAREGVDLLCVPRATPHSSTDKWLAGGQAAAVCSGAYCLSSNLWYPPGEKEDCGGLAWIIDPEGEVLATTHMDSPFATVEIDLNYARASKQTYPRYVLE